MNVARYIGRKYIPREWDCWATCRTISVEQFNVSLPECLYDIERLTESAAERIASEVALHDRWQKLDKPEAGAVALFRIMGRVSHAGLCISEDAFLHSLEGRNTALEYFSDAAWSHRLFGVYRWIAQ
jgi:hypothetical protein